MPGYCLDTNIFIQAQNGPYAMDIVPAFWDWLDQKVDDGNLFSSIMVYQEITAGTDDLADWAKARNNSGLFEAPSPNAQQLIGVISNYVLTNYQQAEANFFLQGADPWVIAQAQATNAKVVTMEKLVGANSKKVKIPNICEHFGIEWLNTYQLLRELNARFTL
ncbi:MAG: DUF4411 family protein [Lewinellaceae bacterium]|nr:DUF4411 family protein [Saprospiraceae bacterium]MCB9342744.1 DUF4411 family protein [Lewinellaceae bacterium]